MSYKLNTIDKFFENIQHLLFDINLNQPKEPNITNIRTNQYIM